MVDQDAVLDNMLGLAPAKAEGSETPGNDPAPATEAPVETEPSTEPEATPEAEPEPKSPEERKFFYFEDDEVKNLPPEAVELLASKDKALRNRYTQKRQADAEAHRKELGRLQAMQEKLQESLTEIALRAIPAKDAPAPVPAADPPSVARLKALGFDDDSISAIRAMAEEITAAKSAPLQERVAKFQAEEEASGAIMKMRGQHPDFEALEPEMAKILEGSEDARRVFDALPTPLDRANYVYALAKAQAPPPPAKASQEEIRKEAERVAKEQAQKRAAAPVKGGAQGASPASKAPIDSFMDGLFVRPTPYG